jgi:predicted RNase H-like HicB family nuclease
MTSKQPRRGKADPQRSGKATSHSLTTFTSPSISAGSVIHAGGGPITAAAPSGAPNGGHPVTVEVLVRLQAIAVPEADGGYSVVVPALAGCFTEGDSIEEVQANIVEAAEGWLAATHDQRREQAVRDMAE